MAPKPYLTLCRLLMALSRFVFVLCDLIIGLGLKTAWLKVGVDVI